MAVGVDEDPRVPTPEGLGRFAADGSAGGPGLFNQLVHLLAGPRAVGEGRATPAAAVGDGTVLCELGAIPEGEDHAARLEEGHVVVGCGTRLPAECLVELLRPVEVGDSERDQADALFHCGSFPRLRVSATLGGPRSLALNISDVH